MDIRPTSDRLRESLFNVLTAGNPDALAGSVWLDLFAGTGAVGIEALSRGAATVYFVEASAAAARLIAENVRPLTLEGWRVLQQDAAGALRSLAAERITAGFVFLDPPYRLQEEYRRVLTGLATSPIVSDGAIAIAEHEKKFMPCEEYGRLRRYRVLVQGDTALSFYRRG
jgi:16S rRNA (guanine(966)-N(2))-methyltransferase RsmD